MSSSQSLVYSILDNSEESERVFIYGSPLLGLSVAFIGDAVLCMQTLWRPVDGHC